jgi:hypothetical protein
MEIAWVKIGNPHLQIVRWLVLVQVISSGKHYAPDGDEESKWILGIFRRLDQMALNMHTVDCSGTRELEAVEWATIS